MKSINKFLVVMLCFVLFTTMAFALSACIEKELKIAKIEVSGPSETAVGEFDYNDYTVKLIFDDGSTKDIKLNKDLLSASDRELLDTPGTHTITVQYNDVTCTFTVTIKGDGESQDKGIKSIAISGPNEIVAGDIDYNDFSLVITYEDDSTTAIELREEFILEEDRAKLNTVGSHSISITYNGTTTTWNITVKENESTGDNIFEGVTFEDATYTYDGREKSIEVKGVPDGATVRYNVSNSYTNAGVYPIEATISKEGYKTLVLTATLTINKATYDMSGVKFVDKTVVYNGETQRIEISGSLPQGVTVSYDNNENINVGTYEVVAKFTGDSNNYETIADMTATLTINKATYDMSSVKFVDKTVVYNGEVQRIEISGSLPQGVTVTYENNDKTDVGTYEVVAKFTGDSNNYETIADMTATLTIIESDFEGVTFEDATCTYDGREKSIEVNGVPNGATVKYNVSNSYTNAGIYPIEATISKEGYKTLVLTATLTINKATYDMSSVEFVDKTVVYNGEVQRIEISGNLPQGVTVSYENNENINVGTYEVVAKFTGDSDNYNVISDKTAQLIINKATYDMSGVEFEGKTVVYNGEVQRIEISGSLPQGVTVTYENNDKTDVGTYEVVAKFTGDSNNYETIADMTANLTINKATYDMSSIEFADKTVIYNGEVQRLAIRGTLPQGVTVSYENNGNINVGTYTVTAKFTGDSKNYKPIADMTATLTIKEAKETEGLMFEKINNDTEYSVVGYEGEDSDIVILSTHEGLPVTTIGYMAFYWCNSLTSITIPDSIMSIGESAFTFCDSLTDVHYTGDIAGWCNIQFDDYISNPMCYADNLYIRGELLEGSLTIPEGVTSIGDYAFYSCNSLISITIPDSVTSIGAMSFANCSNLTSITIPDSVTSIEDSTFYNCYRLTSITIPDSVTSIGNNAFYGCNSLTSITISDRVTSIGENSFSGCSGLTSITIPNSVTSIGEGAFSGCSGLTSITIPDSVTSIGSSTFSNCDSLTSITIPDSVTSIGEGAFSGCSGLTSITIPDSVTSIREGVFSGCSGLTSIMIPDSVTSIGNSAFYYCSGLTSITIPDSVTSIGEWAFYYCSGLTSITIPNSVTSIGERAFYDCTGLTSITIPDSVTSIGDRTFYNCDSLTSITIPDSVTSIGENSFSGCSGLTSITIPFVGEKADGTGATYFGYIFGASRYTDNSSYVPKSLREIIITGGTSIGDDAFYCCSGLTSITIPDSVTSIGYYAFRGCSGLTSITIPDSVTSIGDWAFEYCSGLASVTISDSVTSIGERAFYDCTGLTSITIPNSVTSIGNYAFSGCRGLTSITVAEGNSKYHSQNNCIIETASKTLIAGCKTSVIPDDGSVTSIGNYAFYNCSGLTSITIPDSITSIGDSAFYNCDSVTNITIPDGVTSIGNYAFYNCSGLTSITIPDSVSNIGSYAFYGCSGLTSITIPDSVKSIGDGAFLSCTGLVSITIPFIGENADGTGATYFGYIFGASGYYSNSYYVPESLREVIITGGTKIGSYAFYNCSGLTSITIPDSVTSIGEWAFYNCTGLTSITIPDSVTSIGERAFYNCTGLISITIPDSITSIGRYVFSGCTELTSITIPASVTSIGSSAFYGCSGLTSITIPNGVTSIGNDAFYYCIGLTSVTIGNSVTSIGGYAFEGCSGLTSITIPNSVTSIGEGAFSGCSGLTSIRIGNGVTSIGYSAFKDCSGIESITIPFIGENADGTGATHFGYIFGASRNSYNSSYVPRSLREVTITGGTSIGSSAFYECTGLTSITIPNSVTSIGNYAFDGCRGLTSITVAEGNSKYHSQNNCIIETASKTLIAGCKTSIIPDDGSVTSIGDGAFSGCSGLTSITIPDSVTSIGSYAFYYCSGLTSITIPDSVTSIGSHAFEGCSGLTSITIPDSVTSIGDWAFSGCSGLTSITIPDSVTSIGEWAFYGCSNLTNVTFENTQGWWYSSSSSAMSGTSISSSDLADPATAATYLTSTYYNYYWKRS